MSNAAPKPEPFTQWVCEVQPRCCCVVSANNRWDECCCVVTHVGQSHFCTNCESDMVLINFETGQKVAS